MEGEWRIASAAPPSFSSCFPFSFSDCATDLSTACSALGSVSGVVCCCAITAQPGTSTAKSTSAGIAFIQFLLPVMPTVPLLPLPALKLFRSPGLPMNPPAGATLPWTAQPRPPDLPALLLPDRRPVCGLPSGHYCGHPSSAGGWPAGSYKFPPAPHAPCARIRPYALLPWQFPAARAPRRPWSAHGAVPAPVAAFYERENNTQSTAPAR